MPSVVVFGVQVGNRLGASPKGHDGAATAAANWCRSMLTKLVSPFKEFGCFAGLLYAVDRVFHRFSPSLRLYFYELLVQPIPEQPLLPSRLSRALEIREIAFGAPEIARMPASPEIKESRFKQNAICLAAFQKNELIGYIWFCFRAYDEDEVRCTYVLPEGNQAVFDFDVYLFPEHRMSFGFVGMWSGANEFLRSRGIKFSVSRLTRFNLSSRRAHMRLGAQRVGRLFFLRAWCVEFMVATVAPYVHLSIGNRGRVRLKLHPDALLPRAAASGASGFARQLI